MKRGIIPRGIYPQKISLYDIKDEAVSLGVTN